MQERVAIRLYDDPAKHACGNGGRYSPVDLPSGGKTGVGLAVGDQVPLEDGFGQFLYGTIASIGEEAKTDADGAAYRVAEVRVED